MDAIDRKILSLVQEDGRLSTTDLAHHVGISLSTCHRRLRALEGSGAISHYRAVIAPEAVGLNFEAIIFVTLGRTDRETVAAFETAVLQVPNIVDAQRLFGDPDYMLKALARDVAAYQELYDTALGALPGVQRLTSTMVMKQLSRDRNIPIP
ncbi:Lrp/AsnC family transcriptional regulator [Cellulosimicrobium funkei]|uniref:Lrp/AsnC family transcriptional regulator n=1 Tax=Cellulosimicrobium funkei TaxID=264251 RepID=UPI00087E5F6A|nr:transcriptional regulator, AsnC family [Cellulosimicrobium cellulans]